MPKRTKTPSTPPQPKNEIAPAVPAPLAPALHPQIGQAANAYAAAAVFDDYLRRKADNTLRAQRADLATFAAFLAEINSFNTENAEGSTTEDTEDTERKDEGTERGERDRGGKSKEGAGYAMRKGPAAEELQTAPEAWRGVTWGLVDGFVRHLLRQGYAVESVNRKLSTLKCYAKLAGKAGVLPEAELVRIALITGYGSKEGKRMDARRPTSRVGDKKAAAVSLSYEQACALKRQPADTPQGRRDALLLCLLLDHGLRVGELAALQVEEMDLAAGTLTFYREKVDVTQTHALSQDAAAALAAYCTAGDAPTGGPLLRASLKNGALSHAGMSARAITARVRLLGEAVGVSGLSAHDCRHYWATRAAHMGTDAFVLRDAGGWSSLAMPARYVESAQVANARVKL